MCFDRHSWKSLLLSARGSQIKECKSMGLEKWQQILTLECLHPMHQLIRPCQFIDQIPLYSSGKKSKRMDLPRPSVEDLVLEGLVCWWSTELVNVSMGRLAPCLSRLGGYWIGEGDSIPPSCTKVCEVDSNSINGMGVGQPLTVCYWLLITQYFHARPCITSGPLFRVALLILIVPSHARMSKKHQFCSSYNLIETVFFIKDCGCCCLWGVAPYAQSFFLYITFIHQH